MSLPEPPRSLSLPERHHIVEGLYSVPGLGEHISSWMIDGASCDAQLHVASWPEAWSPAEGAALKTAFQTLQDAQIQVRHYEDHGRAPSIHVCVAGRYQGVDVRVESVLLDESIRDLVRPLTGEQVLDALASYSPGDHLAGVLSEVEPAATGAVA